MIKDKTRDDPNACTALNILLLSSADKTRHPDSAKEYLNISRNSLKKPEEAQGESTSLIWKHERDSSPCFIKIELRACVCVWEWVFAFVRNQIHRLWKCWVSAFYTWALFENHELGELATHCSPHPSHGNRLCCSGFDDSANDDKTKIRLHRMVVSLAKVNYIRL